jgi:hypothetical protein
MKHARSHMERVFSALQIKISNHTKRPPESQQRVSQGHHVRSDFQIIKTQVVFFCEKSPPLAADRHS